MAKQQPPLPPQGPSNLELTLWPAEQLSPAAIDRFYQSRSPDLWRPTHEAWHAIEAGAAAPGADVDYLTIERGFRRTIDQAYIAEDAIKFRVTQQKPPALFPGSEAFLHTILGLAYIPHFAARHNEGRPATAEENNYALKIVGRALYYAHNPRVHTHDATSNVISQLVFHGLFLTEDAPLYIAPASPREVAGPSRSATHHVYGWDQNTQTKDPVRIAYTGRGGRRAASAGVTLLRVGHKLHEAAEGTELPFKFKPDERMRILRRAASLVIDKAKGYRLRPEENQLLDNAQASLYDKIQRDRAKRQRV